ncbi:hypothetical protein D5018_18145 [Parashewanella curva]|uniref:Uncharacterized protein n=1 Tax=Parashewanella curva TaxID=2338552 RepID=A0A3L8PW45_9GAMM|nr:hypothetical protein [Parashewanella curva]RLV58282.1 hypothetical protein D5018_18145 [Parashewanella curva]
MASDTQLASTRSPIHHYQQELDLEAQSLTSGNIEGMTKDFQQALINQKAVREKLTEKWRSPDAALSTPQMLEHLNTIANNGLLPSERLNAFIELRENLAIEHREKLKVYFSQGHETWSLCLYVQEAESNSTLCDFKHEAECKAVYDDHKTVQYFLDRDQLYSLMHDQQTSSSLTREQVNYHFYTLINPSALASNRLQAFISLFDALPHQAKSHFQLFPHGTAHDGLAQYGLADSKWLNIKLGRVDLGYMPVPPDDVSAEQIADGVMLAANSQVKNQGLDDFIKQVQEVKSTRDVTHATAVMGQLVEMSQPTANGATPFFVSFRNREDSSVTVTLKVGNTTRYFNLKSSENDAYAHQQCQQLATKVNRVQHQHYMTFVTQQFSQLQKTINGMQDQEYIGHSMAAIGYFEESFKTYLDSACGAGLKQKLANLKSDTELAVQYSTARVSAQNAFQKLSVELEQMSSQQTLDEAEALFEQFSEDHKVALENGSEVYEKYADLKAQVTSRNLQTQQLLAQAESELTVLEEQLLVTKLHELANVSKAKFSEFKQSYQEMLDKFTVLKTKLETLEQKIEASCSEFETNRLIALGGLRTLTMDLQRLNQQQYIDSASTLLDTFANEHGSVLVDGSELQAQFEKLKAETTTKIEHAQQALKAAKETYTLLDTQIAQTPQHKLASEGDALLKAFSESHQPVLDSNEELKEQFAVLSKGVTDSSDEYDTDYTAAQADMRILGATLRELKGEQLVAQHEGLLNDFSDRYKHCLQATGQLNTNYRTAKNMAEDRCKRFQELKQAAQEELSIISEKMATKKLEELENKVTQQLAEFKLQYEVALEESQQLPVQLAVVENQLVAQKIQCLQDIDTAQDQAMERAFVLMTQYLLEEANIEGLERVCEMQFQTFEQEHPEAIERDVTMVGKLETLKDQVQARLHEHNKAQVALAAGKQQEDEDRVKALSGIKNEVASFHVENMNQEHSNLLVEGLFAEELALDLRAKCFVHLMATSIALLKPKFAFTFIDPKDHPNEGKVVMSFDGIEIINQPLSMTDDDSKDMRSHIKAQSDGFKKSASKDTEKRVEWAGEFCVDEYFTQQLAKATDKVES